MIRDMTKQEKLKLRDETYCLPPGPCCGVCEHVWIPPFGGQEAHCHAIEIRGRLQLKIVKLCGVCDLWEATS